jgi:methionine-rich copper-binding protein CopC
MRELASRRLAASLALGAAMFAGVPAFGHAKLLETSPAAGSQVAGAPQTLTLRFNEPVRLAVLTLRTAGHAVPVSIDRNAAAASVITLAMPPLAAGDYEVQWSALTPSDGHMVKGTYSFVIR